MVMVPTPSLQAQSNAAPNKPDHQPIEVSIALHKNAKNTTLGGKIFDVFTYRFVNLFLNYGLSMVIQDLFLGAKDREDSLPKSYIADKVGNKHFNAFSDFLKNTHGKLKDLTKSETVADLFSLNMGGHVAAAFVYHLEKRKASIIPGLDRKIDSISGRGLTKEKKEKREAYYESLRQEKKPSILKVVMGRLSGMFGNMGFFWALEQVDKGIGLPETLPQKNEKTGEMQNGRLAVRRLTQWVGEGYKQDVLQHAERQNTLESISDQKQKRLSYWPEIMTYDFLCTIINALVLEKVVKFDWSKMFGGKDSAEPKAEDKKPMAEQNGPGTQNHRTDNTAQPAKATETEPRFVVSDKKRRHRPTFEDIIYQRAQEEEAEQGMGEEWKKRGTYEPNDEVGVQI